MFASSGQVHVAHIHAQAIGTLADNPPKTGDVLSGLLVAKDYSYTLLAPCDLRDFAGLTTCTVTQRQRIVLGVGWNLVKWHLEGMYGSVEEGLDKDGVPAMRVSFKPKSSASQPSD
jgi:cleavage and polyadenylation specificity factor subunit 3